MILDAAGAGLAVPPGDPDAFVAALQVLLADPARCADMGRAGRAWVEENASPVAVGAAYDELLNALRHC